MNLKPALLLSRAIALSIAAAPVSAVAQSEPSLAPENPNVPVNLKLNDRQKGAIQQISEFAFDQIETILSSGLESGKVNPPEPSPQTEQMFREFAASMRPDKEQVAELRSILETARQQMKRQLETGTPQK
jgi:hypothetical protein